jgi:transcriptional regulator with XRE-family HTH domain
MGVNELIKIGEKMKSLRKATGISQKNMAAQLNLKTSTYSNYENGYSEPPAKVIYSFAEKMHIDVSKLLITLVPEPIWKEGRTPHIDHVFAPHISSLGYRLGVRENPSSHVLTFPDGESFLIDDDFDLVKIQEQSEKYLMFLLEKYREREDLLFETPPFLKRRKRADKSG